MDSNKNKFLLIFATMTVSACTNKVDFSKVQESTLPTNDIGISTVVCGVNQVKVTRPTRILFVVDQSGSNVNGPYEAPGQATDPQKSFRTNVMQNFYQSNQNKGNISWGLNVFNNRNAVNLMKNDFDQTIPFGATAANFNSALNSFILRTDVGDTPYKAALKLVKETIENDLPTAPKHVNYVVAFMTDGYPTDYCPGSPAEVSCAGRILESNIDDDVKAISNLAQGSIQFSTVYYGKPDSDASNRLKRMATVGSGDFVDTNTTTQVNLNDILQVEEEVCVEK